jgi:hypothetical protein
VSTSTSVMIQVLAVFYSVLVAFVIVGERSAISEANDHVAAEAGAMSALFHDVGGFPPDVREPVREAIVAYNLALIVALEHPFSGSIAVSDQPLRVGVLAPTGR